MLMISTILSSLVNQLIWMFGPARLAACSVHRTGSTLPKLSKMQGSNPSHSAMLFPNFYQPPQTSEGHPSQQPGTKSASLLGQFPGIPVSHSQHGVKGQGIGLSNILQGSKSCTYQPQWPSSSFPLPPAASSRSYHTRCPSLAISTSSKRQESLSKVNNASHQSGTRYEQSQPKRSLHCSSADSKKMRSSGSSASTTDCQRTSSSQSEQQKDAEGRESSSTDQGGELASAKPPRPDLSRFRRKWKTTAIGHQHRASRKTSDVAVTVLCYNVLAQCLVNSNMYLYEHCHQDFLNWDFRKHNLLREIKEADSDILCLQEVQACHFSDFFCPKLKKLGYAGIYQQRTGDKHDGCAIFYKTDKLVLDRCKKVEFYNSRVQLLDRDNVAILALFHPKAWPEDGPKLCVATTHLLYNPKRGDIKLVQLGVLLAEIDSMAAVTSPAPAHSLNPSYHPVILCGDFNSTPHCPLYNLIKTRKLDYVGVPRVRVSGQETGRRSLDSLAWPLWPFNVGVTDSCQFRRVVRERLRNYSIQRTKQGEASDSSNTAVVSKDWERRFSERVHHAFHLESVHCHDSDILEVTTNHSSTNCTVDYIFYSSSPPDIKGTSADCPPTKRLGELKLLGYRSLLTDEEANEMGGLPNHVWSSDHFALLAKFLLTSGK